MKSQFIGLWKQDRSGWYSSPVIEKSKFSGKNFRIILRQNKFYEADSNKPRFIFAIADSDSVQNLTVKFDSDLFEANLIMYDRLLRLADEIKFAAIRGSEVSNGYKNEYFYDIENQIEYMVEGLKILKGGE